MPSSAYLPLSGSSISTGGLGVHLAEGGTESGSLPSEMRCSEDVIWIVHSQMPIVVSCIYYRYIASVCMFCDGCTIKSNVVVLPAASPPQSVSAAVARGQWAQDHRRTTACRCRAGIFHLFLFFFTLKMQSLNHIAYYAVACLHGEMIAFATDYNKPYVALCLHIPTLFCIYVITKASSNLKSIPYSLPLS